MRCSFFLFSFSFAFLFWLHPTGRKANRKSFSPTRSIRQNAPKSAPSLSRGRGPIRSGAGSSPLAEFEGGQYDAAEGFDEKEMDLDLDPDSDSDSDSDPDLDSDLDLDAGLGSESSDWKEAYDRPELYDSAFSFRDFSEEVWGETGWNS